MSADNAIYIRPLKNGKFAVDCISSLYHEEMTDGHELTMERVRIGD